MERIPNIKWQKNFEKWLYHLPHHIFCLVNSLLSVHFWLRPKFLLYSSGSLLWHSKALFFSSRLRYLPASPPIWGWHCATLLSSDCHRKEHIILAAEVEGITHLQTTLYHFPKLGKSVRPKLRTLREPDHSNGIIQIRGPACPWACMCEHTHETVASKSQE